MKENEDRLLAAALLRLEHLTRSESFDPNSPSSRPTEAQLEVIKEFGVIPIQWIAAANRSGKTATCARIIGWALTDSHPTWKAPDSWKEEGMLILVASRTGKHIEESLWPKIRACLTPGTYKEVRIGNIMQRVEMLDTKHRIVFQSLENPNIARERLQSYDAHIAWLDELVDSTSLISELALRITTKGGCFMASFTPLIPAPSVKKMVDGAKLPLSKKYIFKTRDNPVFNDPRKWDMYLASLVGLPESEIKTRLEGEWAVGESHVYSLDFDTTVEFPPDYSRLWRHVEVVDPALSSALGLTIWAEDPKSNVWYCVRAEYIRGIYIPTKVIEAVREITKDYNIIRRRSDPHEVWYIQQAAEMGIHYEGVYKKNERKGELIMGLQQALGSRVRISPTCSNLIEELQTCRWSDRAENKIVNASSFHLLDTAQYFCDNIPKAENNILAISHHDWLYQANEKRKVAEEKKKNQLEKKIKLRRGRSAWN